MISICKGDVLSSLTKTNMRISTEIELVGAEKSVPMLLWIKHFIEAQGYTVYHNIPYQDNKSSILCMKRVYYPF